MSAGYIDTHHHVVPPGYAAWLAERGVDSGGMAPPEWSVDSALAAMDELGVQTAILSLSMPGVHLGDDREARIKARAVNDFAAEVVKDRPERFGLFATLTLPDVEGAIAEAARAFDELHADGVILLANVRGQYLGDAAFEPLMAELDRRRAVIFVHPAALPAEPLPGVPAWAADFLLDTTRAAINLAASGVMTRYPDLKIILAHGGGFVPYASYRIAPLCDGERDGARGLAALRRFYYDTAITSSPAALPTLLAFADPARITYGSDWPFAPLRVGRIYTGHLERYALAEQQRNAIAHSNAEALFPRLRSTVS